MLTLNGIIFPDDPAILTPNIRTAILDRSFEAQEARGLASLMQPGERVLELGAGTGFISTLLDRCATVEQVWAVEANAELLPYMKRLHHANRCTKVQRLHAVLSDDPSANATGTVPFYHRPDFWMGSLLQGPNPYHAISHVPVQSLSRFLARHRISAIVCDIEGAECDVFARADLSQIRLLQVEVHDHISGLTGVQRLIRTLDAKGLFYDPRPSGQSLMVFRRVSLPEQLRPYHADLATA